MSPLLGGVVGDKDAVFFQRRELRDVIRIQHKLCERKRRKRAEVEEASVESQENDEENLTKGGIMLMRNVLSLSKSTANDMVQFPIEENVQVGDRDILLFPYVIVEMFANGYNFIPAYENADAPASVTQILMEEMLIVFIYRSTSEGVCV